MKRFLNVYGLPLLVLLGGILGALLRYILYTTGIDDRGLLVSGHFAWILLWVVTLAVAALLIVQTLPLQQANKYRFNFPRSVLSACGYSLSAIGLVVTAILALTGVENTLTLICGILGFCAAAALSFLGYCRWKGIRPSILYSVVICVFLIVRLVYCYQIWSADPQLQDYIFPLLANIGAAIACYQSAVFTDGDGSRKMHTISHLATGYCALVSLPFCESPILYAALAVWMFSDLCNLRPMPRGLWKQE